jgi:hypothetical protein
MTFAEKSRRNLLGHSNLENIMEDYVKNEEELTLREKNLANFAMICDSAEALSHNNQAIADL